MAEFLIFTFMVYSLLKFWVRMALPFFARRIHFLHRQAMAEQGPLLLAVNHPNSFLDALLLGAFFRAPVHFIARGDVFKKAWIRKILHHMHMIPIYRIRDGKEMLSLNDETFLRSVEVLRQGGVLLIFVEGFCENQSTLQLPLKKGAPRILQRCWQEGIPARVLPAWLEYSSFNRIGKTVDIRMGTVFGRDHFQRIDDATCIPKINAETARQLLHLHNAKPFSHGQAPAWVRAGLFLPAMLGAVLHAPVYLPVQMAVAHQTRDNVHYDSVLLAILLCIYPLVLIVLGGWAYAFTGQWWMWPLALLGMPALALSYIHWKK